jgi:two-component system, cell cycle sensor histidine kinase and response regulator CckA
MTANQDTAGKILVVDDNEANRYTVVRLLRKAGFTVSEAADGRRGLEAATTDLDLIILDIRMPELDGYEVCRRVKADPALKVVPILHMSATYTAGTDIAYGLEGGADGYLVHPVDPAVLLATVRAFLRIRHTDRALRESESRLLARAQELEAVMAATPAAVMIAHDPECRQITGNPAAHELLRLPLGTNTSLPSASVSAPVHYQFRREGMDVAAEELPVQVAARTGRPVEGVELEIVFDDDTRKLVHGSATPLFDAAGAVRGAVGAFVDVTEQRQARAQLERAQRMESLGRLAGGIAHETNNQMSVVLGLADFVLQGANLDAEQRRDLGEVRRAADRVAQLTRQLLALSRRQLLRTEPVELDPLLRDAQRILVRLLGPDFPLQLELGATDTWVRADRTQLIQVLLNLGINARDAMPGGGPLLITTRSGVRPSLPGRLGRQWKPGEKVATLSVRDSGSGIDPSISTRIFEPFFTTKPVGSGSGLGLAVVEGIVAQSSGEIWVESAPGQGTTITLALPILDQPRPEEERREPRAADGSETLLIVDDEPAVRHLLSRQLSEHGYNVLEASSGAEALHLLRTHARDIRLVVTDIAMPAMTGTDLAREAAALNRDIPFIFVTGQPREALADFGNPVQYGMLLEKPFSSDRLAHVVRSVLNHAVARG